MLRRIFGWRFWLNYGVSLLVTCWLPLQYVTITTETGEVVSRQAIPVYRCYWHWATHFTTTSLTAILIHLGICFGVCVFVWGGLAWGTRKQEQGEEKSA